MTEWKTYTLKELSKGKGEYGIGAPAVPFDDEKYTYLRITDINDDGTLNTSGMMSVDAEDAEKYILEKNDIVFARTGNSTGRSYFYDGRDGELVYAGFLIRFRLDETKANPKILKYYTHSKQYYDWVKSFDTGGTRGNINAKTYGDMPIYLPPRHIQDRIAGILGAIDDKIENNRRINTNLELQAQALYKQWFVDFNFPNEDRKPYKSSGGKMVDSELGLIPEGWSVGNIGGYCKIRSGYAFKSSWWADRGVKIIKIKNITENGVLDMSECSYVDIKHCDKASDFNGHAGDLIIAMTGATLGKVCIIPYHTTDYYINQRVGKFFLGDNPINKLPFIHCILRDENVMSEIINKGQGSAQPNISASDIETIKIVMPSYYIMDKFNLLLQSNYALWLKNMAEVNSFAKLRDTLLPKLMNGEIKL